MTLMVRNVLHKLTFSMNIVALRRGREGFQLNVIITLSIQKSVWRCPLNQLKCASVLDVYLFYSEFFLLSYQI